MRRTSDRWLAALLAAVLCLGVMTGCRRETDGEPKGDWSTAFSGGSGELSTGSETEPSDHESQEVSREEQHDTEADTETMPETEPPEPEEESREQSTEGMREELPEETEGQEVTDSEEPEPTDDEQPEATEPKWIEESKKTEASEAVTKEEETPSREPVEPSATVTTEAEPETGRESEISTEPVTEPERTEAPESETEEVTEPMTQPVERETEQESEKATERETESSTEAETEHETEEVVLASIAIKANQSQYTEGWKLTKANLTVTVYYSDGTSGMLTAGYTIHQTGDQVYVTYAGVESNTITVIYEKTLSSITIASKVNQYEQGYQLISANLAVTLHYSDGSTEPLTNGYTIHQSGASVYITYEGVASNTITVNYAAASRVEITPRAESYGLGEVITVDDFIVTAYQSDGSSQVVSGDLRLYYQGREITSVTLTEYEGDIYVMGAHCFQVSYKGVLSESVILKVRYEEKGYLYREMLALVNEARAEAGLPALTWDIEAEEEILVRAEELTRLYSHDRPDGSSKYDLYPAFAGENIANGGYYSRTHVQDVFDAWMNSGGHRALILRDSALATGFVCAYYIATDENGNQAAYTVMWVTSD